MSTIEQTSLVHVVATVDPTDGVGKILYVNPSNVRSNKDPLQGLDRSETALVLRDSAGQEIARVHPNIRFDACAGHGEHRLGLIQQDIELPGNLAALELVYRDSVLDTFHPAGAAPAPDVVGGMTLDTPLSGVDARSRLGSAVAPREGVTYMIQAKPDNSGVWNTLAIGRKTPEFQIDKNQFPGATSLQVRVIQNAGFTRRVVDEREIPLE